MMEHNKNIQHIIIVTAFHYGVAVNSTKYGKKHKYSYTTENEEMNFKILLTFIQLLRSKYPNVSIHIRSSKNVDNDLVYLSHSKNLVTTGGGFSKIACAQQKIISLNHYKQIQQ